MGSKTWFIAGVVVAIVWTGQQAAWLPSWLIQRDLRRFGQVIRKSDCSLAEKERLLDRLDVLETRLRDGASVGLSRWWECSQVVDELIDNGITPDEVRLIERELVKVERR